MNITYDPNLRSFTVRLPDGGSFQAARYHEAELAYLLAVAPALGQRVAQLSAARPELASRARRAARLVLAGAVRLAERGEVSRSNGRVHRTATVLAHVRSEDGAWEYLITRDDAGKAVCNCPDGSPLDAEAGAPSSRAASHTCKHIIAAFLIA